VDKLLNIAGLFLIVVGGLLLFKFGRAAPMDPEGDIDKRGSSVGVGLFVIGIVLQLTGTFLP
jgi:hypothetical protein